ncbi:MAG: cell envelope integrity protein TolA, partial [Alphaproteobacteria bacterium]|nr:cell envelope integrity protein TolA [Alphaproteobacteria bacterium]
GALGGAWAALGALPPIEEMLVSREVRVTLTREPEPPPPEPEPAPEPEAEAEAPEPEPEMKIAAAPRPKPTPPKPTPPAKEKPEEDFFARTAALLDKMPKEEAAEPTEAQEARPRAPDDIRIRTAAGRANSMSLSEIDSLRQQIERCWSFPAGAAYAEELIVTLRLALNPDGSLIGRPEIVDTLKYGLGDTFYRVAADSAVRAVLRCQPFTLPPEKYENWRSVEVEFDPRNLLSP